MESVKLTQYSRSAGCGCKIAPTQLQEILKSNSPNPFFENLIIGYNTNDDAAVVDIGNNQCIISTTDFFMPIVDDAFEFGKIAAANSISDVYAMGGKPIMAVGILGFPIEKLSTDVAQKILEGAREICAQANIPLAGGHSIDSLEPFFGLAVTGIIDKQNIKTNAGAKESDILFITKPIGTGILATALKRNLINTVDYKTLIECTTQLNKIGEYLGSLSHVHALTDVTGFGLLGHCTEMSKASNLCAEIILSKVPILDGVDEYLKQFIYPDNTTRNLNAYKDTTSGMDGLEFLTLCDPQTNGGLLISVNGNDVEKFELQMKKQQIKVYQIGMMKKRREQDEVFVKLIS